MANSNLVANAAKNAANNKPENNEFKERAEQAEFIANALKRQMIDIAIESNRRHSELQTKLQTFEGVRSFLY